MKATLNLPHGIGTSAFPSPALGRILLTGMTTSFVELFKMRYWLALSITLPLACWHPAASQAQSLTPAEGTEPDASAVTVEANPQLRDNAIFLGWAQNIARAMAETANGGLTVYRPEASMYGPPLSAPLVINDDGSLTFTFRGSYPWQMDASGSKSYSIESEVVISPDHQITLPYNGPLR